MPLSGSPSGGFGVHGVHLDPVERESIARSDRHCLLLWDPRFDDRLHALDRLT